MWQVIKFFFRHRKDLKLLGKQLNDVNRATKKALLDHKIDRAELKTILIEVDGLLDKIIELLDD